MNLTSYFQKLCNKNHSSGYSLVELLVSAVIVSIIVVMVVSTARTGSDIDTTDLMRRQVRIEIDRLMETTYSNRNYLDLEPDVPINRQQTINLLIQSDPQLPAQQVAVQINENVVNANMNINGTAVDYLHVRITAQWAYRNGTNDNLIFEKFIPFTFYST